jgi:hypothetical protein
MTPAKRARKRFGVKSCYRHVSSNAQIRGAVANMVSISMKIPICIMCDRPGLLPCAPQSLFCCLEEQSREAILRARCSYDERAVGIPPPQPPLRTRPWQAVHDVTVRYEELISVQLLLQTVEGRQPRREATLAGGILGEGTLLEAVSSCSCGVGVDGGSSWHAAWPHVDLVRAGSVAAVPAPL